MQTVTPEFPKELFVIVEHDPQAEHVYYEADPVPGNIGTDGDLVAVYELKEVRRKRVTHHLD